MACFLAAIYLMVCFCVAFFQTRLIYFPTREYKFTPADVGLDYEDLTLETGDGVSIAAWYLPHPDAKASILFCHGNAGNISDRLDSIKLLQIRGYNVLIFDYRGFGRSEGKPSEAGTYLDAEAGWAYLTQVRGEAADRIILFGRSLGGAVAIELAVRHPPVALVVESSFTCLTDIARIHYPWLPVGLILRHRYDSIEKVKNLACQKLFIHGEDDELIPLANSRQLFDAASPPKSFLTTPGGHNEAGFGYSPAYGDQLASFLESALAHRKRDLISLAR